MKKIEAIIRKTHFDSVKEALFAADINWFSYSEVKAIGQDMSDASLKPNVRKAKLQGLVMKYGPDLGKKAKAALESSK